MIAGNQRTGQQNAFALIDALTDTADKYPVADLHAQTAPGFIDPFQIASGHDEWLRALSHKRSYPRYFEMIYRLALF